MDIGDLHTLLDFYLKKSLGGYVPPEQKDAAIDRAQIEYFEQIKPAYGTSDVLSDALVPFKEDWTFTNGTSTAGLLTFPSDYLHLLSIVSVVADDNGTHYIGVPIAQEDKIASKTNSQLIPNNVYNPFAVLKAGKTCQLYPPQPAAGYLYYLRKPAKPKFDYSLTNNRPVYKPDTSTQLEWNEAATEKIIWITLGLLGINTQDQTAIQISQAKEAAANANH